MRYGLNPEWVNLKDPHDRDEVERFLRGFDLLLDQDVDYTIILREEASQEAAIIATCSKAKSVLKCFAVQKEHRGEGITSILISALLDKLSEQGIYHSFIFTKPKNVPVFSALNYQLIQSTADVALLENGIYNIHQALAEMKKNYTIGDEKKAAFVMNCNSFTPGQRYLIEEASKNNQEVLVFIVEEDQSLIPFQTRYDLVRQGVSDLKNVKVIPSGEYMISETTFPSYFFKEEGERLRAYTELKATIFAQYFCQSFQITKRYVGAEPFCPVTEAYNEALKKILPAYAVELQEVPQHEPRKGDCG